jgi:hypothetical protein
MFVNLALLQELSTIGYAVAVVVVATVLIIASR